MFMTAFKEQPKETKVNLHPTTDFCKDIIAVNDPADCAVKDVAKYAEMTRDPNHRDNIILVANDLWGRVAHLRKPNLNLV